MLVVAMQWRGANEKGPLMDTEFYFTVMEMFQNSEEVVMAQLFELKQLLLGEPVSHGCGALCVTSFETLSTSRQRDTVWMGLWKPEK